VVWGEAFGEVGCRRCTFEPCVCLQLPSSGDGDVVLGVIVHQSQVSPEHQGCLRRQPTGVDLDVLRLSG